MTHLTEGSKAPAFKTKDQFGNTLSTTELKGKKWVLYFYPKDMTSTCTVQACNLRDNYSALLKAGIQVIGINDNDEKMHQKFTDKNNLPFPLIADVDRTIINKYGVWGEKSMYGNKYMGIHRTTFLIDEKGIIQKIILKPKSSEHAKEIVKAWKEIGAHK